MSLLGTSPACTAQLYHQPHPKHGWRPKPLTLTLTLVAVHDFTGHQPCMHCTAVCDCLHLVWLNTLSGSVLNAGKEWEPVVLHSTKTMQQQQQGVLFC
jgi:hypothetical protein